MISVYYRGSIVRQLRAEEIKYGLYNLLISLFDHLSTLENISDTSPPHWKQQAWLFPYDGKIPVLSKQSMYYRGEQCQE